ncbi:MULTISPECIES: DUF6602 domain-containing protein [unclassified Roseitalea]|uniref:DUF6602 domain-containing protein n=1 Tax=unclassified Roseitalea TaxID=2639107 RepID=UPI00273F6806|nr:MULTISPECIES: DUF6602 domain-containing protein [unclassified Roseitalea]
MNVVDILNEQQRLLTDQLNAARRKFSQSGNRGDHLEDAFRSFLNDHTPSSLTVGTGEVVSLDGYDNHRVSRQLDVVVNTRNQPFRNDVNEAGVYLIEGVAAAGEVKSVLNSSMIETELLKSSQFRSLIAKPVSNLIAVRNPDTWESYYCFYRPYFLLCLESKLPWQRVAISILECIRDTRRIPIDAVFFLDSGMIFLISPFQKRPWSYSKGTPFGHDIYSYKSVVGFFDLMKISSPLAMFIAWLSYFRGSMVEDMNPIQYYIQEGLPIAEDIVLPQGRICLADGEDINSWAVRRAGEFVADPLNGLLDALKSSLRN